MNLSWQPWVYGLFSSLIGGGSGAVSAAIGVNILDPNDWGITRHPGHLFTLMGVCFAVNGAIATFAFLAKSPLPQVEVVTTKEVVETQPAGKGTKAITLRTTTTSTEPEEGAL